MPTQSIARLAGWFLLFFIVSTSSAAQTPASDNRLTLVYTGKLLGYARVPDKQLRDPSLRGCPVLDPNRPDDLAKRLIDHLNTPGALIVGMGDNFSPELDARRFQEGELKDIYTWDPNATNGGQWTHNGPALVPMLPAIASGHTTIPTDNVGCFFRLAGYSALVPGKHDFYYGPERLRAIARFLATPPAGERQVHMLAANLVIDTKDVKAAPRFTPEQKKKRTTPRYETSYDKTKVDLPAVVLPWMREFTVQYAGELVDTSTAVPHQIVAIDSVSSPDGLEVTEEFTYASTRAEQTPLKDKRYAVKSRIVSAWVCPGSDNDVSAKNDPDDFTLPSDPDGKKVCQELKELYRPAKRSLSLNTVFRIPAGSSELKPDHNYGLCLGIPSITVSKEEEARTKYFCTPFTSHAPFFQYEHPLAATPNSPTMPAQNSPNAYVSVDVRRGERTDHVAVFGVVDPDLPEHIGALNYSWTHEKPQLAYDTAVTTIDPKIAIQQLMQKCWIDDGCRGARKVLLAQMPPFKAAQLAGRLTRNWFNNGRAEAEQGNDWFDVIVSEADEELATGNEDRTKIVPPLGAATSVAPPVEGWVRTDDHPRSPFVVVPDGLHEVTRQADCTALDPAGVDRCIRVTVQRADITPEEVAIADQPNKKLPQWRLHHLSEATTVRLKPDAGNQMTLFDAASETLKALVPALALSNAPKLGKVETLQQLALQLMTSVEPRADIAFIQRRDLYAPEWHADQRIDAATLQAMLNRVFWKADYSLPIQATGATIKEVLKKSAQYQTSESSSLSTDAETGRSLISLGVYMDPETKEYVINGQRVEDGRMYGVAATDYVGLGDTGYPELVVKPPVATDRVPDIHEFYRVATAVCMAIRKNVKRLNDATCDSKEPGDDVDAQWQLDGIDQRPADTTKGFTATQKFKDWFKVSGPKIRMAKLPAVEAAVQDRRTWNVILDSAHFEYSRSDHNLHATEAANTFAGVSNARVTSPIVHSWTVGYQLRNILQTRRRDYFINSDLSFAREDTEQSTKDADGKDQDVFLRNQKANQVNGELGVYWHVWPADKQIGGVKVLTSIRVETQPKDPLTTLSSDIRVPTHRRTFAAARGGMRLDGDHRWFEFGGQRGELWHSIYAYKFDDGICSATDARKDFSLVKCLTDHKLNASSKLDPLDHNRPQGGLFLNAHGEMPLGKFALVLDNRAEFFFKTRDDASVDTRTYDNFIASLRVPVFGNLSIAPKLDWYYFTNKAQYNTMTNTQFVFTVDYRFEWHQGIPLWRSLWYANPATASK